MRAADFIEETTTSIAGTGGDGAVTLTQITGRPRFSSAFGTQNTTCRYTIEDTVNNHYETGIGHVSSNVLTRTRPQITWDGSTWDDSTPSPLAFGSSPTSGNIRVRMSAMAETFEGAIPGHNSVVAGDATWRDYPISNHMAWDNDGTTATLTANREQYWLYYLSCPGLLNGAQFEVISSSASDSLKWALYSCGHNGMPAAKIVDFVTTSVASTGVKTDTATGSWSPAGPVWLTGGWYFVGAISAGAPGLRGFSPFSFNGRRNPLGRFNGYGWGNSVYIAGSYSTGLPATPNLSGGTMDTITDAIGGVWFGLKVTP